jgi:hypothetical protein
MAHIVNDTRTTECLNDWTANKPFHVISFFFWRLGSPLQRSRLGLLRSLLHQLLDEVSGLVEKVLKDFPVPEGRIPAWTEQKLRLMMKSALTSASDTLLCFFIDGIDEFDGDPDDLLDVIFALQEYAHVKFCISSRPELLISQRLSRCTCLRME